MRPHREIQRVKPLKPTWHISLERMLLWPVFIIYKTNEEIVITTDVIHKRSSLTLHITKPNILFYQSKIIQAMLYCKWEIESGLGGGGGVHSYWVTRIKHSPKKKGNLRTLLNHLIMSKTNTFLPLKKVNSIYESTSVHILTSKQDSGEETLFSVNYSSAQDFLRQIFIYRLQKKNQKQSFWGFLHRCVHMFACVCVRCLWNFVQLCSYITMFCVGLPTSRLAACLEGTHEEESPASSLCPHLGWDVT